MANIAKAVRRCVQLCRASLRYGARLATGDRDTWRYLPYQVSMACRGVDLRGLVPEEGRLSEERSYRDSGGPDLERVLDNLPIAGSDSILDIGCGKAGAMLTLASYPFRRVDGVEISPGLVAAAEQNLRRLGISKATVFCADAVEFRDIDRYTYIYMYNPFPEEVMRAVLKNIIASVKRTPRHLTIIYKNPVYARLFVDSGLDEHANTGDRRLRHPFNLYIWDPSLQPKKTSVLVAQ